MSLITLLCFTQYGVQGVKAASKPDSPASFVYVENTPVIDEFARSSSIALGYPAGKDAPLQMASLREDQVFLYEVGAKSVRPIRELKGFPTAISSVAFGDYNGDGRDDLWVGAQGSGNLYVYGLYGEVPLLEETDRTWSNVVQILTPDLNGDSFPDAVVRTSAPQGNVYVYLRRPSGLKEVWQSGGREANVKYIRANDIDGDGQEELILARESSYVAVWRWQNANGATPEETRAPLSGLGAMVAEKPGYLLGEERPLRPVPAAREGAMVKVAEWYPPGPITFLEVVDSDLNGRPEITMATDKGNIHIFSVDSRGRLVEEKMRYDREVAVGIRLMAGLQPNGPVMLLGNVANQVAVWEQKQENGEWKYIRTWQGQFSLPFNSAKAVDSMLLLFADDGLHILHREPADYIDVVNSSGEAVQVNDLNPVADHGELFLRALEDWKPLLGLAAHWDREKQRITLLRGLRHLIIYLDQPKAVLDEANVELPQAPLVKDGVVYLSLETVKLLVPGVSWDVRSRVLTVP